MRRLSLVVLGVAAVNALVFLVRLIMAPRADFVAMSPDDSWYYLSLADHFAKSGSWTFDGITTTSGFHPLYGYALAGLASIIKSRSALPLAATVLSFVVTAGVVAVAARGLARAGRWPWVLAIGLMFASRFFAHQATIVIEWPFALVFTALFWQEVSRGGGRLGAPQVRMRAALWAFLAVLSRTDLVLLIGLVTGWEALCQLRERRVAWRPALPFIVAVAAWCLVGLHSEMITGRWIQDSAAAKLAWASASGPTPGPIITMLAQAFVPFELRFGFGLSGATRIAIVAIVATLGIGVVAAIRLRRRRAPGARAASGTALYGLAAVVIVAYVVVYSFATGLDTWYSAPFVVPLTLLLGFALERVGSWLPSWSLAAVCTAYVVAHVVALQRFIDHRPDQRAVLALEEGASVRAGATVGSFNAGLVNYVDGGDVVNLDGLVNGEIAGYRARGDLACYLVDRHIRYIRDLDVTRLPPSDWVYLGDPDALVPAALREIDSRDGPGDNRAVEYLVDLEALARQPRCADRGVAP